MINSYDGVFLLNVFYKTVIINIITVVINIITYLKVTVLKNETKQNVGSVCSYTIKIEKLGLWNR